MRLDLSGKIWAGDGPSPDVLESVAGEIRRPFIELIDLLSVARGADLDWWVTPLASRNTYACQLYLRLCRLVLAVRLIRSGRVTEVVVDSPALARAIVTAVGKGVRVSVAGGTWKAHLSRVLGAFRRYAGALYHVGSQFLFSRWALPGKAPTAGPVILVDTFLYADSVAGGRLRDRHYPGMLDYLDDSERAQVFFAPSYYGIRNYAKFFRELRMAKDCLVLKEAVLRPGDYLFALAHPFRLRWPRGRFDFLGMNVGPLIREALAESFAGSGAVEGLLRYRFAQRLKQRGVRLLRIVEWFENQEVDHGANAGWRTFFPDTPVIGYQGFLASRHYLCMFPLTRERTLRLVPNRVAVIGQGLVEPVREFCPELEVDVAPSFRFEAVWRERSAEPDADWFTVLVSLPILPEESRAILDVVAQAASRTQAGRPWRFYVKPHPTSRQNEIARIAIGLPEGFDVVNGDFGELLDRSDALIGAASSTCAHAIARGVPVAVVGRPGGLVQNPIPLFTDPSLWAVCYTAADLALTIGRYADGGRADVARWRDLGRSFRERFFEPVTRESVRRFLGFDDTSHAASRASVAS